MNPTTHTNRLLGYIADDLGSPHSPAISAPPAGEQIHILPDTESPLNEPTAFSVGSLEHTSPGPASTATKGPTAAQAQIPLAGVPFQVAPDTFISEASGPDGRTLTAWTSTAVNSLDLGGLLKNVSRGTGDGFTVNVGGHGTSGACTSRFAYWNIPAYLSQL